MKRRNGHLRVVETNIKAQRKPSNKFTHERDLDPILPKTETQQAYMKALSSSEQVVVLGPAGTGKTFIAGCHASDLLRTRKIEKIFITRPNVPGGRSLGFFPGSLEEKIAPWVVPLTEAIKARMGEGPYEVALKNGDIEIVPFEVMRGRTFNDCIVILDEAQNTLPCEMKMFLTRIGENCQVIVNGDVSQTDLKETSGLRTMIHLAKSQNLPVPIIEFTRADIVRSGVCAMWVEAFDISKI